MPKGKRMSSEEKIAQLQLQIKMELAKADRTSEEKFALDCVTKLRKGISDEVFTEEEENSVQNFIQLIEDRIL